MNTRLKIICILFGAAYFYIIGEQVITEEIADGMTGYRDGRAMANKELEKQNSGNWNGQEAEMFKTCFFSAIPKSGLSTFPTSFVNLKNSSFILANVGNFRAKIANPIKLPIWFTVANGFEVLFSFIVLFLLIYVPVQTYKTIRSVVKNEIFEIKTIHRIRRIGYALLIIFGFLTLISFASYLEAKELISLEDYKIVFSMKADYSFLLFGLVTLLFAEILKMSHQMKVEQDFTI
jgi:hypothetical protein